MPVFDWRYELSSMWGGMARDLQQQVGQSVTWYVYDPVSTNVDPIYDVGSAATAVPSTFTPVFTPPAGRRWKAPVRVPVLSAIKLEATEVRNDRGFYTVDTLSLTFSVQAARRVGLADLVFKPNDHDVDRVVYENKVFGVDQVRVRGMVTGDYALIAASCTQVKAEEMVNDPDFFKYILTDDQA